MNIELTIFFVLLILIISTVILTKYRQAFLQNYAIETFTSVNSCDKIKKCTSCVNRGSCAWSEDTTSCMLIPQNVTGLILNKDDCPGINVDIEDNTSNVQPNPDTGSTPAPVNIQSTNNQQQVNYIIPGGQVIPSSSQVQPTPSPPQPTPPQPIPIKPISVQQYGGGGAGTRGKVITGGGGERGGGV